MKGLGLVLCVFLAFTAQAAGDMKARERWPDRWDPNIGADPAVISLYFSLSDLALEDQRAQMWALPNDTKAALWMYNIKRYLRDHPELSAEAQELLRTGIRLVATPAWFDMGPGSFGYDPQTNALSDFKERTSRVLSRETVFDVFIRLGSDPVHAVPHPATTVFEPRADVLNACSCASGFDCGSTSSYGCYDSWCEPARHCGWFGFEWCTGKCKSNG